MPAEAIDRIAFYGTLMRRAENRLAGLDLGDALEYLEDCVIPGELYHLGDYPGLVPGQAAVPGELYRVRDAEALAILDDFEEVDPSQPEASLYLRRAVRLISPAVVAWVYFYNGNVEKLNRLDAWPPPPA